MNNLEDLVQEFLYLLNIAEESDSGRRFFPNRVTSCRVMDGERMNQLLTEMQRIVNE